MTIFGDLDRAGTRTLWFHKMSSGGRGEYEVTGRQGDIVARDLLEKYFVIETPFGNRETNIRLGNQGGKYRLRARNKSPQIARQLAAMLFLPKSTRSEDAVSEALPILLQGRYILDVQFELLATSHDAAQIRPLAILARSGNISDEESMLKIDVSDRNSRLGALYLRKNFLPEPLTSLVASHEAFVAGSEVVDGELERIVVETLEVLGDSDLDYIPGSDPLAILEQLAGINAGEVYVPYPFETPEGDLEIRLRSEHIYRERRIRGPKATKFKKNVQSAYRFSCLFCGLRAPSIAGRMKPGVDAAHILPYGDYDLDVTQNGLLLCKQHHWAFDNHVLELRHSRGAYYVALGSDVTTVFGEGSPTLAMFESVTGRVHEDRLPTKSLRPSPVYLDELYR